MVKGLTRMQRNRLENPILLSSLKRTTKSKFYHDVLKKGDELIDELIFLFKFLPESYRSEIINREKLKPLIDSILIINMDKDLDDGKLYEIIEGNKFEIDEKDYEKQKERLLDIVNLIIDVITNDRLVKTLTPKANALYSDWIDRQEKRITLLRLEKQISRK
jgi:hypothetical protein